MAINSKMIVLTQIRNDIFMNERTYRSVGRSVAFTKIRKEINNSRPIARVRANYYATFSNPYKRSRLFLPNLFDIYTEQSIGIILTFKTDMKLLN